MTNITAALAGDFLDNSLAVNTTEGLDAPGVTVRIEIVNGTFADEEGNDTGKTVLFFTSNPIGIIHYYFLLGNPGNSIISVYYQNNLVAQNVITVNA